ncbi:MAG: hypothetical protein GF334_09190, partial [Candidatus Altiarchaeales archaeon]|nr:hypothetical protein [Candidatus Altiarchaeales archaeon]
MNKVYLYPYHPKSETAGLVAKELGIRRIKHKNSSVKDSKDLIIVNWGSSNLPYNEATIINIPEGVAVAANKLSFFRLADESNVRIPRFTTDKEVAASWLNQGREVCIRKKLTANSGVGLSVISKLDDLVDAPLYTQ